MRKKSKKFVRSITVTGILPNGLVGHRSTFTWNPAYEVLTVAEKASKGAIKKAVINYLDKIKMDSMSRYINKPGSKRIVIVNTNRGKYAI